VPILTENALLERRRDVEMMDGKNICYLKFLIAAVILFYCYLYLFLLKT
jgi:hypothetical protein